MANIGALLKTLGKASLLYGAPTALAVGKMVPTLLYLRYVFDPVARITTASPFGNLQLYEQLKRHIRSKGVQLLEGKYQSQELKPNMTAEEIAQDFFRDVIGPQLVEVAKRKGAIYYNPKDLRFKYTDKDVLNMTKGINPYIALSPDFIGNPYILAHEYGHHLQSPELRHSIGKGPSFDKYVFPTTVASLGWKGLMKTRLRNILARKRILRLLAHQRFLKGLSFMPLASYMLGRLANLKKYWGEIDASYRGAKTLRELLPKNSPITEKAKATILPFLGMPSYIIGG